jgi:GNAT superfamily N-acetyltransferase
LIRVAESERDVARWLEVRNAVFPAIAMTSAALQAADRRGPPGRRKLLADEGGFAIAMPPDAGTPEPWLTVGVLPEQRRRGIGGALWTAAAEHLATLGITTVRSVSMDGDVDGARFLQHRGSAVSARHRKLERDLAVALPPAPALPPGIVVREVAFVAGPELEAVYRLEVETAADIPGEEEVELPPFADWMVEVAAEGPDPLVVAAFDGDDPIGMAVVVFPGLPPGTALHWMTATRRSHRRRGVARALKHASLAGAAARGARVANTFNDDRNAGMRALNEEYGYRPGTDLLIWKGPCSG